MIENTENHQPSVNDQGNHFISSPYKAGGRREKLDCISGNKKMQGEPYMVSLARENSPSSTNNKWSVYILVWKSYSKK